MIVVLIVGWIFLSRLAAGRRVYAIGGNELAARFSGIRVERVKLGVYLISGLCAGIAALLSLGYYGAATSGDGQGYELNVIAAAVVGGASLTGGRGSALGVVLGALIIQMISSGIVILGIDQKLQPDHHRLRRDRRRRPRQPQHLARQAPPHRRRALIQLWPQKAQILFPVFISSPSRL